MSIFTYVGANIPPACSTLNQVEVQIHGQLFTGAAVCSVIATAVVLKRFRLALIIAATVCTAPAESVSVSCPRALQQAQLVVYLTC